MADKIVFAFGSKNINELPGGMDLYIDDLILDEVQFVIGDCDGADVVIQRYLADKGYKNVWIHASYNPATDERKKCRNNLGNWPVHYIATDYPSGTYEYRRAKDIAMINMCDEAFCIWDKVSKGTKKNIEELTAIGKEPNIMIHFGAFLSNIKSIDRIIVADDIRTTDENEVINEIELKESGEDE